MITADGTREAVHEFAQAVRDALSDLPADEVDELTDGLEADLFERAADGGGTDAFGDPALYADELRTSAGLPERPSQPRHYTAAERLGATAAARWKATARSVRGNRFGAWLIDLAVALRPVWWVLRGWVVWQVVALVFSHQGYPIIPVGDRYGEDFLQWVLLLGFVLFSIQWGRGRWMPGRWARGLLVLVSIGSVIALLPVLTSAINEGAVTVQQATSQPDYSASNGMFDSGRQVYNIYAYDSDGKLLQNVRLYDQDGNQLVTAPDETYSDYGAQNHYGERFTVTPNPLGSGVLGWSIYPLPTKAAVQYPPFPQLGPLSPSEEMTPGAAAPTPTSTPTATPAG